MRGENLRLVFKKLLTFDDNIIGVGHGNKLIRGKDTGRMAVIILVREKYRSKNSNSSLFIPRKIDGLETDVVEVGNIKLLDIQSKRNNDTADTAVDVLRTAKVRPAQPGMSIGHHKISAGTFGCLVKDRKSGLIYILSNNHVLANLTNGSDERSQKGDAIYQPGVYDGGNDDAVIGYLERFIPLYMTETLSECKYANLFKDIVNRIVHFIKPNYRIQVLKRTEKYNDVDCAIAKISSSNDVKADVFECGKILGINNNVIPGMMVKKSGRTTGVTYGMVLATNVTLNVQISDNEYAVFTNQVLSSPMSMPGDSGSLVMTEDNHAVGLLFAGSQQATMFTPIEHVLDALQVELILG